MSSANPSLPPVPYNSPLVNDQGIITLQWINFFRQLFLRAGGLNAPANSQITNQTTVITALQTSVTSLTTRVSALESEFNDLSQGRQL